MESTVRAMAARGVEDAHDEGPGASTTTTAVVQVAVGESHSLALTASGSLFTWGRGQFGRMGMGVFQDELVPTQVEITSVESPLDEAGPESSSRESGLDTTEQSRISQIAAGSYHSLALSGDGTVWSWGFNACMDGQLGREGAASYPAPIAFLRPSSFSFDDNQNKTSQSSKTTDSSRTKMVLVEAGGMMSSAIDKDGGLWLWGAVPEPSAGVQITDSEAGSHKSDAFELANVEKPGRVLALRDQRVRRVACGNEHILALVENRNGHGVVECYAWGSNSYGQLGLADFEARDMPTLVTAVPAMGSTTIVDVDCGAFHSVVVTTRGGGDEETESDSSASMARKRQGSPAVPGQVMDQGTVLAKLRGMATPEETQVRSRGYPYNGRIQSSSYGGDGSSRAYSQGSMASWAVSHGGRAPARDTGRLSMCWTFGQGENGQLGHGACVSSHTPAVVEALPAGERILVAVCGVFHTLVVTESGDVWVWGMEGGMGMCPGIGPPGSSSGDALTPVRVFGESSATCNPITGAKGVACGLAHTVTVSNRGTDLWAWGRGKNGVLGLGHHSDSWFPSPVMWPPGSQFDSATDAYPDHRKSSSRASSRGGGSRGRGDEVHPYARDAESDFKRSSYGRSPVPEQYVDDRAPRAGYSNLGKDVDSPGRASQREPSGHPSRRARDHSAPDDTPRDRGISSPTQASRRGGGDQFWQPPETPSEPENAPRRFTSGALQSEDVASLKAELTECRRYAESLHAAVYGGVESFALNLPRSNYHDLRFSTARKPMYDGAALQNWQQRVEDASLEELAKLELFYKGMRNRLKDVLFQRRMEDWCRRSMSGMAPSSSYHQAEPPLVRDPYSVQNTPYFDRPGELALRMSGILNDRGEVPPPAALAASIAELQMLFHRRR